MARGKVKFFNADKGYGFISPENGNSDVFVHVSNIDPTEYRESLSDGELVEYEVGEGRKGPEAVSVRVLTNA